MFPADVIVADVTRVISLQSDVDFRQVVVRHNRRLFVAHVGGANNRHVEVTAICIETSSERYTEFRTIETECSQ